MDSLDRRTFLKMLAAATTAPALSSTLAESAHARNWFDNREGVFIIKNAAVISMIPGAKPEIMDVLVKRGTIVKLAPPGQAGEPQACRVIEAQGKYLIPALIDSHCHIANPFHSIMDPLYMAAGVTAVRDMATPRFFWAGRGPGGGFDDRSLAGPRVFTVAGFFDGPPGVFSWAIIPKNKHEVEHYLDEIAEHKIRALKIYSYMTPEILAYFKEGASRRGLFIAGHAPLSLGAGGAIEAGMQELEHNYGMAETVFNIRDTSFYLNLRHYGANWLKLKDREAELIALLKKMKTLDVTLVPTHKVIQGLGKTDLPEAHDDPRLKYLPDFVPNYIWAPGGPTVYNWKKEDFISYRECIPVTAHFTRLAKEEGVKVLVGTDCPVNYSLPGFGVHDELKNFVDYAGFTPEEALAAATREAARHVGVDDRLGTITEGKLADLVLLDKNPLEDISAVSAIAAVFFNGGVALRETIDQELNKLSKRYRTFLLQDFVNLGAKIGVSSLGRWTILRTPPGGWEQE